MTSVAILASDPLTQEGAVARFSSYPGLEVRNWEAGYKAAVLLVLATKITAAILARIEEVRTYAPGSAPKLVVVADEFSEAQVFQMIDLELTGLLYRKQSSFDRVVDAIVLSAAGRLQLPERVQHCLVSRFKSIEMAEPDAPAPVRLTEREVQVLRLLANGLSTRELAMKLNYSERTIKNIIHDIVIRLKTRNRTHAVAHALQVGII